MPSVPPALGPPSEKWNRSHGESLFSDATKLSQYLLDYAPGAALVAVDLGGVIRSWSQSAQQLTLLPADAAVGRAFREVFPTSLTALGARAPVGDGRHRFYRGDGGSFQAEVTSGPLRDELGHEIGSIKMIRAVDFPETESPEPSEEAFAWAMPLLKATFNQASVGIALLSPRLKWITYNGRLEEMLGAEGHALASVPFVNLVHPEDRPRFEQLTERLLRGPSSGDQEQLRLLRRNGSSVWVLLSQSSVKENESGATRFLLCILQDITSLKVAEQARSEFYEISRFDLERLKRERRLREQLVQLGAQRDRFVATLTHDMRTPLTAALLGADLLLRNRELTDSCRDFATRIRRNLTRIESMIRDLLDARRIQAGGRFPLKIDAYELRHLLQDTVAELPRSARERIVLDIPEEVEGFWCYDGLRRVVENLISNALKYGSENRPVALRVRKQDVFVEISVHNEGKAMSGAEMATIFDPFQRAAFAESGGKTGWGLGLTLVRGIVESHGGTVKVESNADQGTTFTVCLPLDARPFQAKA